MLRSAYSSALAHAERLGAREVALPAISAGIYGYPWADAAAVALGALGDALSTHVVVERVRMVLFSEELYEVFAVRLVGLRIA